MIFDAMVFGAARVVMLYLSTGLVFVALAGLGQGSRLLLGDRRALRLLLRLPLQVAVGWAIAALVSAIGAVLALDQGGLAGGLLGAGLLCLVPTSRAAAADRLALLAAACCLLVLMAPLGLLVAATPATAYDEFAQWLPNTRYLVEHRHYWFWPDWSDASSKPGYPNASVTIALLVSTLIGPQVEAPFKLFGLLIMGAFGGVLLDQGAVVTGRKPRPQGTRPAAVLRFVAMLAAGCLIAVTQPFFDPRIGLTALTDNPSAILLALAGLTLAEAIVVARRDERADARGGFALCGLVLLALALLRTTNLVLVGALSLGALLLLWRRCRLRLIMAWAPLLVGPPVVGAVVWRLYLARAGIGPDMAPRALGAWDWAAPAIVARAFLVDRLGHHPLIGAIALAGVAVGVAGAAWFWRRSAKVRAPSPALRPLLILTAVVVLVFLLFLAWSYIAVFSADEVARAASLWRYLSELGPLLLIAGAAMLASLRRGAAVAGHWRHGVAALVSVAALWLLPWVARDYYALACRYPDVVAARLVGGALDAEFAGLGAPVPRLVTVHPTMGDWMAFAIAFDQRWPASDRVVLSRTGERSWPEITAWARAQDADAILDLTPINRAALAADAPIPPVSLWQRSADADDGWVLRTRTVPLSLPPCGLSALWAGEGRS